MKIAIVTTGRFHVLDLARELLAFGHEVTFYSILPASRVVRFGLPASAHRSLLPWLLPLVALQRYGGVRVREALNPVLLNAVDRVVARRLEPCDIFIGMSGLCVDSARAAKARYEAKILIERGSRHILSQKAILDAITRHSPRAKSVPGYAVRRELASYDVADKIVVPSRHAAASFVEHGIEEQRLFRNPYGVDLGMFMPTPAPADKAASAIFVGAWSYRKGCDVLVDAMARLENEVTLLHVGACGDTPFPNQTSFRHQDPVPQWQLMQYYARAHVFVLPSREDGFGLVMVQALACGLPIVCTDRTGGEDLVELTKLREGVFIVPHEDADALARAIEQAIEWARSKFEAGEVRDLLGTCRDQLAWRDYGRRYSTELDILLSA